jgi:dihydroorotate dehydrogenase
MKSLYKIIRPLIFRIEPEKAHNLTLKALKTGMFPSCKGIDHSRLKVNLWGLDFPNPTGMAAGFDKNAEVIMPVFSLGFGFVEAGTVTPRPQKGNEKPRIFRSPENEAVINRMGFPNEGLSFFKRNLEKIREQDKQPAGPIGLNIGMNKEQEDPAADYCYLIRELGSLADYFVINISSPNTPGLRNLQEPAHLAVLLEKIMAEREASCGPAAPPLLLKLAPDLKETEQEAIAATVISSGVDGLILTNTTLSRPENLAPGFAKETGGLSGSPLRDLSTSVIKNFYTFTGGKIPIIGLGGISSGQDAYAKIKAGASLVQIYSALVFHGPDVVKRINNEILACLDRDGYNHISDAVGTGIDNVTDSLQRQIS